jgi:hypothetical protein
LHRATPVSTSIRSYVAGGSRSTVNAADDQHFMQESGANMMANESRDKIESPQNFGFTSVVMDAIQKMGGSAMGSASGMMSQIAASAETFVSFMGGNRSFPVIGNMDDRRHRLQGLDQGDSGMFSTQGRKQQFHMSSDGGFWSAPQDKTVRMAVLSEDSEKDQTSQSYQAQQSAQLPGGRAHAAALAAVAAGRIPDISVPLIDPIPGVPTLYDTGGTGSATSGTNSAGTYNGMKMGQKSLKQKNQDSKRFIHVTKDEAAQSGTNVRGYLDDGNGYYEVNKDKNMYCGALKGKGQFALVSTLKGPAKNTLAKL